MWASGDPVTYTNWCPGEPNDAGGNEDAGIMSNESTGIDLCWNDVPVQPTTRAFGIVERTVEEPMHLFLPLVLRSH